MNVYRSESRDVQHALRQDLSESDLDEVQKMIDRIRKGG